MKITLKQYRTASAIFVALSLSACARFDTRMQANGSFDYQQVELISPYQTGDFSTNEAREHYDIPALTEQQKIVGLQGSDVDVRPPTQLLAVIDGVLLESNKNGPTKILFNAFNHNEDMQSKVWGVITSYLAEKNIEIVHQDAFQLQTGILSEQVIFGNYFNENNVLKKSSYKISLEKQPDGQSVVLIVDALSYAETNDEKKLVLKLEGRTKQSIELRFVNHLLEYAYFVNQSEKLAAADNHPLTIKLGFDDNHQSAWIADSEFLDTWRKLPALFTLLNFDIVDHDKNLGYFLLRYKKPDSDYWAENNLTPFDLNEAEYFIQLGEVTGGTTSIVWLDKDKKTLTTDKITKIYLSITGQVREALLEKEKQTKKL